MSQSVRLHHVRPRFKNDVEGVLLFMAEQVAAMKPCVPEDFRVSLNERIRAYPGNHDKLQKTIDNWRTEITSLFGFVQHRGDLLVPGAVALRLAQSQDVPEFFYNFLWRFQYPGAHLKPERVARMVEQGVRFRPAPYFLSVLLVLEGIDHREAYLTKAEATHLVFNDLSVSSGAEDSASTASRILAHRRVGPSLDNSGDVTRYAGDILDYMVNARLLFDTVGRYRLRGGSDTLVRPLAESNDYFTGYDELYGAPRVDSADAAAAAPEWFDWVNDLEGIGHSGIVGRRTAAVEGASGTSPGQAKPQPGRVDAGAERAAVLANHLITPRAVGTHQVGLEGEALIVAHERARLRAAGLANMQHLVNFIPTANAVGYDIQSINDNGSKRYVEVKTTRMRARPSAITVKLTENEFNSAATLGPSYFVYRVFLTDDGNKLFVIQDPVAKYKVGLVDVYLNDGPMLTFQQTSGAWEEILE